MNDEIEAAPTAPAIAPPVRAAMLYLRHTDCIRSPLKFEIFSPDGRDLTAREQKAEDAALDLLTTYFKAAQQPTFEE